MTPQYVLSTYCLSLRPLHIWLRLLSPHILYSTHSTLCLFTSYHPFTLCWCFTLVVNPLLTTIAHHISGVWCTCQACNELLERTRTSTACSDHLAQHVVLHFDIVHLPSLRRASWASSCASDDPIHDRRYPAPAILLTLQRQWYNVATVKADSYGMIYVLPTWYEYITYMYASIASHVSITSHASHDRVTCVDHIVRIDRITCITCIDRIAYTHASIASHVSITSCASIASHASYATIASHTCMHRSHHMYRLHCIHACIDHIICIDRVTWSHHIICIDRVTWSRHMHRSHNLTSIAWHVRLPYSLTTLRGSKTHGTQYSVIHPVLTQEDTDVRACTSDANLIAPTSTNMLHIYEQQLLIRHNHYSIWKLCWFHFMHQSESSVLDRVEAWTAIITVRTQFMPTPCNTSRVTD